jgi:hypothetical protein
MHRSLLLLFAAALLAQNPAPPDFSGHWEVIMEDGNLIPPYLGEKIKIEQKGSSFIITTTAEKPSTFRVAADGKQYVNKAKHLRVTTTARWEGAALILNSVLLTPKAEKATAKERWTLSPNGKKLSMQGYFQGPKSKQNQLLEYDRK